MTTHSHIYTDCCFFSFYSTLYSIKYTYTCWEHKKEEEKWRCTQAKPIESHLQKKETLISSTYFPNSPRDKAF